ncbi:MAG TPA: signal recognition particle-docking protein FtsY [Planktothrix sp.]|jgi:fused signal recognition particle receptor
MAEQENENRGWFGKLREKLSRTKNAIVDSIVDRDAQPGQEPDTTPPVPPDVSAVEELQQHEPQPVGAWQQSAQIVTPPVQPTSVQPAKPIAPPRAPQPPREIDDDYLEDMEEKLIKADIGVSNAHKIAQDLRKQAKAKSWNSRDVEAFLRREFTDMLKTATSPALKCEPGKLNVYVIVGVNGTGKTTSIGKLAWRFRQEGKKVLMAAADTFRAAAETQLEIWSERAGVDIVRLPDGSDPGAVCYQALQKAKQDNYDCLVIDTAGRLHNKANLMAELKKVRSVIEKNSLGLPLESLLVLDASTGQNGLQQARVFGDVCPLTGVILTKLDGTAKGGVVFSISRDLKIPVKLIGLGEKMEDLRDFDPTMFVEALFS